MKRVAIIPARGGSKRLPRKNIRPFHGKPILHYPIAAAKASRLFDDVIVTTDDEEIATVAMLGGCSTVIKRPPELASDTATTAAAIRHAVQYLTREGAGLEHVCCIYPCTPLILPADFHAGFNRLVESGKCYVFTVTPYEQHPARSLRVFDDGRVQSHMPQYDNMRNQDLEPVVHDAGQWYWGTVDAWLNEIPIFGSWSIGHRLPRWRAIDIDTIDDWTVAEAVFAAKLHEGGLQP